MRALGTRCTWIHMSSSTTSGRPMCRKESSEKKRSLTLSAYTKLRISVPLNGGSQSSISKLVTVTYCASASQGSMYPLTPEA